MSIWDTMRKQSLGDDSKSEDIAVVYPGHLSSSDVLLKGTFNECNYIISTTGLFPVVDIVVSQPLSIFAGTSLVKMKDIDGEDYMLNRSTSGVESYYSLTLNRSNDFVKNEHEGKTYTVDELQSIAEKIIARILDEEYDLKKRID